MLNNLFIFLFILFLPTQLGKHFFPDFAYLSGLRVDYLSPTLYLSDMLVIILFFLNLKTVIKFFTHKKLLVILGLLLLNVFFALSKELAFYRFLKIIEAIVIYAVIARKFTLSLSKGSNLIVWGFLMGSMFEFILTLLQFTQKHSIQGIFYWLGERYFTLSTPGIAKASINGIEFLRPYGTFSHPNSMAGFYLLVYFFTLTFSVIVSHQWRRSNLIVFLKYSLLTLSSLLVFFSFSKIAITTYILLNIIYLFQTKFYKHCIFCFWGRITVLSIIGGVFFLAQTDPLTTQKRIDLIKNAFTIITQHPLTGVGLGNYLIAQNSFNSKYLNFLNQPVHNIFLLSLAELGLPLFLFIILDNMKYLIQRFKLDFSFMLYVLCFIFTGFFDHYWLTLQQNVLLLPTILALISLNKRSK